MRRPEVTRRLHAPIRATALLLILAWLMPAAAQAQGMRFWVGVRGDYFSGSGDVFKGFDNDFGFGLEAGLGFGRFAIASEALIMGEGQYLLHANLGGEWHFDEGVRLGIGAFTGPMLFIFPEEEVRGVDLSVLAPTYQEALLEATGFASLAEAEAQFDAAMQEEQDLSRLAFGWNVARLRLSADLPAGPLYLGVAAQVGYHLLIGGDEVAAGIKNRAVDELAAEYGLPASLDSPLREALGARPVDTGRLHGVNWDFNVYLRFEL